MARNLALANENQANPVFYVCLAFLLMGFLFGVSMIVSGGSEAEDPAAPNASGGGGAYPLPIFPHSPVNTNSPVPNGPAVTIVEDVRETMHRLPLDRNNPKGWSNPSVKKKKPGGGG
jgi:hypothetical protein